MLVIVPPQTYFELLTKAPELMLGDGSYLSFWAVYLKPAHLCRGKECLTPTWNHLWFVAYLWPLCRDRHVGRCAARRLPGGHGRWPCPPGPGCWCRRCP